MKMSKQARFQFLLENIDFQLIPRNAHMMHVLCILRYVNKYLSWVDRSMCILLFSRPRELESLNVKRFGPLKCSTWHDSLEFLDLSLYYVGFPRTRTLAYN